MQKLGLCAALFFLISASTPADSSPSAVPRYQSIFSFGDSFADTGNNPVVFRQNSIFDPVTRPPYGSTFFGHPTGCNSDGRLIIDFVAENLGLPYVPPTLAYNGSFRQGANFAVGAATALDANFFHERDIPGAPSKFPLNTSLGVQLEWFESMKPSLCGTGAQPETLIIKHGARSLVVPGVLPSGCSPPILTKYANPIGIIYVDFFGPIMEMVESPHKFGFEEDVLRVCCGGPGRYGLNSTVPCGDAAATTCAHPSARLYWDGVHLTEAANRHVADRWLGKINSFT
ncbi:unnamed protein product [Alopecurus aequalis]